MVFSDRFYGGDSRVCTREEHVPAPLFRKKFALETLPTSFEVTVCGLGVYELYINGKRVTKGYLAPYRSNPDHILYYDRYELSKELSVGENVIALALGNGILSSNIAVWDNDKYPWRSAPKFALAAEADGKQLFDASSFVTAGGEVTYNDWHCTEYIDARLVKHGWTEVGYDDAAWLPVSPASAPKGEKKLCTADPVTVYEQRTPVRMWKGERGYLFDFGASGAGTYRLRIKGECGQVIRVYFSDCVIEGKKITNRNLYCWSLTDEIAEEMQRDTLTLSGGEDVFEPRFTFKGFRYAEIVGITPQQAEALEITFLMFSNGFGQAGAFSCDNEEIRRLQACVCASDRSNFIHFPLDCPQREKNGWTGDAALSAEQLLLNFDCANSLTVWLENICRAQREDGSLPGIVPTATWGYAWGAGPGWDDVLFELPYRIYLYTGSLDAIRLCAPHMQKYLGYMKSKRDERGLFAYGLEDWLPVNVHTPLYVTDTILCKSIAEKAQACFLLIGMQKEAAEAGALAAEIKQAFRKHVLRPWELDGPLGADNTQATHAMSIYYGMYEGEELASAVYKLRYRIGQAGGHMDFGAIANRVFWRVVGEYMGVDEALAIMLHPVYPSFAALLPHGMTTLWEGFEQFEGDLAHVPANIPDGFWSFNHHFWGDISAFFYRYLAGICIDAPNFVRFAPQFARTVRRVRAEHRFACGKFFVEIEHDGKRASCRVGVPEGIQTQLVPPAGWKTDAEVLVPGENIVTFQRTEDD